MAYIFQVRAGTQLWSAEVYAVNDTDAVELARQSAVDFNGVRWFDSITVWKEDKLHVATVRLAKVQTEVTYK